MPYGQRWRRLRVVVPLILLVMILMRLVWMQLRSYPAIDDVRAAAALAEVQQKYGLTCLYQSLESPARYATPAQHQLAQVATAWLVTPGNMLLAYMSCKAELAEAQQFARLNQWLLASTVVMAALMTRFLTSSWTVALIVGAVLLSRGRLLTDLGRVASDGVVFFCVTTWFACLAHYLRTGARATMLGAALAALMCALVERAGLVLCLVTPVALVLGFCCRGPLLKPVIYKLRAVNRQLRELYRVAQAKAKAQPSAGGALAELKAESEVESFFGRLSAGARWMLGMEFPSEAHRAVRINYERGTLFRTIGVPFLLWVYARERWGRLAFFWLAIFGGALAMSVAFFWAGLGVAERGLLPQIVASLDGSLSGNMAIWSEAWRRFNFERLDLHLILSLGVIVLCALQSPAAGLTGVFEASWLALLALGFFGLFVFGLDYADAMVLHQLYGMHVRDWIVTETLSRPFLLWMEPVVLSLGVAGVYNLMKVFDTHIAEKR